ncbi:MAG: DEAD/DEAH box helicase [Saprospiraceae bacterium]|nr:DEAD/DEAH box helicase [Saprospiraceae bacterium]
MNSLNTQLFQTSVNYNQDNAVMVNESITLRPYQLEAIDKIFQKWHSGFRSILFQMPTGTGKTILFADIVRQEFQKEKKILIVVHKKELLNQAKDELINLSIDFGIIMAGEIPDNSKIVQIASIQTLSKRDYPDADLIIIDESHHGVAKTYKELWDIYPNAKFLGVTATPIRLNGDGFDDLFDELITSDSIQKFISKGFLVPVTHFVCSTPDLSKIKLRIGDYDKLPLSHIMMQDFIMSDLVRSYREKCPGKSAIVFAVNVEHSKQIAAVYNRAGISAAHIDSSTPALEREKILTDFRNKKIKIVSNVEIITEGFDFPECEVVQLARPTKSLALYLQMVGRVMRPAVGKTEGIVLDHANLWLEHGLSTIDRKWSLKGLGKDKKEETEIQVCAMRENGAVKKIYRDNLEELKGLKLVPLTEEYKRLLVFEGKLWYSIRKKLKLLYSYNFYKGYLKDNNLKFTYREFEYIQKRLNCFNTMVPEAQKFHANFWNYEAINLGLIQPKSRVPINKPSVSTRQLQYASYS